MTTPPATRLERRDLLRLEEAGLNAWPALHHMLIDGWLLRFAGGHTKRANSVNTHYGSSLGDGTDETDAVVDRRIALCEAIYVRQGLTPTFRVTPLSQPRDLDDRLAARGYRHFDATHVQTLDLANAPDAGTETALYSVTLDTWLETYASFSGKATSPYQRAIMDAMVPERILGCLEHQGRTVACGMAVAEPPYVGLFSLIVDPALRRRGYGHALVVALLDWGQQKGATCAYLQVQASNPPAQALYAKMGFVEAYTYWYRVKD